MTRNMCTVLWEDNVNLGISCRKQTPSHGSKQRCLYDKGHTEIGEILWNSSEPTQGRQSIVQKLLSSPEKWKPCIDRNWINLSSMEKFLGALHGLWFQTVYNCNLFWKDIDTWHIWNDSESLKLKHAIYMYGTCISFRFRSKDLNKYQNITLFTCQILW